MDLRGEALSLTLLPRQSDPKSADVDVLRAALSTLPLYLAIGETNDSFRNFIITSLLNPTLDSLASFPPEIRDQFPVIFGECVCAFVSGAKLKVDPIDETSEVKFRVTCGRCDEGKRRQEGEDTADLVETSNHDLRWAKSFFALLRVDQEIAPHPSASTRRAFIMALHRVFNHVQREEQFREFVESALVALVDPDYGVRMALAHLIPEMIKNRRLFKSILKARDESG